MWLRRGEPPPNGGAEADGTPIKIGLGYAETGRWRITYNQTDAVAEAWAQWVSTEMDGVNGHPVEIVLGDTKSDAAEAAAAADFQVTDETFDGLLPQPITFTEGTTEPTASGCSSWKTASSNRSRPAIPATAPKATSRPAASPCSETPAAVRIVTLIAVCAPSVTNLGASTCESLRGLNLTDLSSMVPTGPTRTAGLGGAG